ncbi:MAG: hypothetical protein JO344_19520, partial [Planctomycetaceae bacterium]|nr:hypothetical protein [Planctomycetaceae bacterium]
MAPERGIACFVGGLAFAVVVTEGMLNADLVGLAGLSLGTAVRRGP